MISLCEDISRQLHGWLNSLQNTEIKGVRYLTDEIREQTARKKRVDALLAQFRAATPLPKND